MMLNKRIAELDANLDRIRELSETIDLSHFVIKTEPTKVHLKFKKGGCGLIHVAKKEEYAICEVEVTELAEMEWHAHEELEIIIVLEGEMLVEYEDLSKMLLKANDVLVIKGGIKHRVIYGMGKNWQLCLTIPACKEFPNG
jgi:quercetin dioxygenase-like cupin family protein